MVGFERAIDDLGRIVLPMEYREKMGITDRSKLLICEEDGVITIRPARRICKICGSTENVNEEMPLCSECLKKANHFNA